MIVHWRKGTCSEKDRCAFLHSEKPIKDRPAATPAQSPKPDPKAKAKAGAKGGASMSFAKIEAHTRIRMAYFQANSTGPPPSVDLSNSFDPLASAVAMPIIPKARACDFSCCLAGGDTQGIITKKVAFHKHQNQGFKKA